jgi:hypothetical protein
MALARPTGSKISKHAEIRIPPHRLGMVRAGLQSSSVFYETHCALYPHLAVFAAISIWGTENGLALVL